MSAARRRILFGLVGVLVVLALAIVVLGSMLVDAYATSRARSELGARGVQCDERFSVDVSPLLASATVTPTRCTVAEGMVESFELLDPVVLDVDGLRPSHVRAGRVRVALRTDPPAVRSARWGLALQMLAIPTRLGLVVTSASRLAGSGLPKSEVASIEIVRSEHTLVTLRGLTADGAVPLHLHADRVELPPLAERVPDALTGITPLDARAEITPLDMTATAKRVELEGDVVASALGALFGAASQRFHLSLTVDRLDGPAPTFHLRPVPGGL